MALPRSLRIAVDIGGTFTDCVLQGESGFRFVSKAPTTKQDPSLGVIDCLDAAAERLRVDVRELITRTSAFVHGTTVGTNALTERRGVRTGLLMTQGHEQTMIIGRVRQKVTGLSEREKIHVTHLSKADPPIIAPEDILPVIERIDRDGKVVVRMDLAAAERSLDALVDNGIESLAIVLLWSFVNPTHEEQLLALARRRHPKLFVSLSSEVAPRSGEYERCVSTAFNSYIGPIVGDYLVRLEHRLKDLGMRCALLVMQANGGLTTVDAVRGRPLLTVDSGPAGGVLGSRFAAALIGERNVICADVGGTTFDVGLVFGDRLQMDPAPVIDRYAYLMPKIFVKSIGAGGGSIAWIDDGGSLRVGPQSAGAHPGPVAYGKGGTQATVTDAHVAAGYLSPDFPLGGSVRVDRARAEHALDQLANTLGISMIEVAAGILEIANAQMADLVRKVTVERGLDPRKFAIFPYGGAGPIFAASLAAQVGAALAYIPAESGVFSALGMLTTDIVLHEERSVTFRLPIDATRLDELNRRFAAIDARTHNRFVDAGFDATRVVLTRTVDMRFGMQVHELEIDAPTGMLTLAQLSALGESFPTIYEASYGAGSAYTAAGVDIVTLRSIGTIAIERPNLEAPGSTIVGSSHLGQRQAYFSNAGGFVDTAVHAGDRVVPGGEIIGPAIIQRFADTVVIPPRWSVTVDKFGGLNLRRS